MGLRPCPRPPKGHHPPAQSSPGHASQHLQRHSVTSVPFYPRPGWMGLGAPWSVEGGRGDKVRFKAPSTQTSLRFSDPVQKSNQKASFVYHKLPPASSCGSGAARAQPGLPEAAPPGLAAGAPGPAQPGCKSGSGCWDTTGAPLESRV